MLFRSGAIKIAKYLHLGPDDNVVTVATDGFDRYDSVLQSLEKRELEIADFVLERWFKDIFLRASTDYVEDARVPSVKERLFKQKEFDWLKFGYSKAYLDSMKQMAFWDHEYNLIKDYDQKILAKRGQDL